MKIFVFLLATLLPFSFLKAQDNPDSLIKKLKVSEVDIDQGTRRAGLEQYDAYGNLTYHKYDDFAGSTYLKVSSTRIYNADRQLIQTKSTHSSYPNDTTVWNYQYDTGKNLVSIKDNKGQNIFSYLYDESGRRIKESSFNSSGVIIIENTFKYDKNGNETEEIMNMTSLPLRINKTYYDPLNRKTKSESVENNKVRFATTYLYAANTNLLTKKVYDEESDGSMLDGVNYKYDDKSRLIARLHFNQNDGKETITGEEHFEYFDNGLIKKYSENIFTANHVTRTFVYSYKFYH